MLLLSCDKVGDYDGVGSDINSEIEIPIFFLPGFLVTERPVWMAVALGYRLEPQGHHLVHDLHVLCHYLEPGKLHVYLLLQVASYLVDLIGTHPV